MVIDSNTKKIWFSLHRSETSTPLRKFSGCIFLAPSLSQTGGFTLVVRRHLEYFSISFAFACLSHVSYAPAHVSIVRMLHALIVTNILEAARMLRFLEAGGANARQRHCHERPRQRCPAKITSRPKDMMASALPNYEV
jgi:hypothetical protein